MCLQLTGDHFQDQINGNVGFCEEGKTRVPGEKPQRKGENQQRNLLQYAIAYS